MIISKNATIFRKVLKGYAIIDKFFLIILFFRQKYVRMNCAFGTERNDNIYEKKNF